MEDDYNNVDSHYDITITKFVNAEFKIKVELILPLTEEQFIEGNKKIKYIVNTDDAIIDFGAYGKGKIYHMEYTKL